LEIVKRIFIVIIALGVLAVVALAFSRAQPPENISAEITSLQTSDSIAGYARADHVRSFQWPQDQGPHPDFQTEWWYYTGNLDTADGRHFGYQLTFFRRAITSTTTVRNSDWATNQVYFAHFALSDIKNNRHFATERFSRGAAGLAGASGDPYHVWLENWEVTSLNADGSRVQLKAEDSGRVINLTLDAAKPLVLQGDHGLSQKAEGVGNASYYVSYTRLATEGSITTNGETVSVKGLSWMDHEFSTTELGPNAVGWDWFSIQLSDQRELMLFQIRQKDGSIDPLASGTLVEPDGSTKSLKREQFNVRVLSTWKSGKSGATYPSRWEVTIPSADIQLTLEPYMADQEMNLSLVYWEGAVKIGGGSNGASVNGSGYVELTGYAPLPGEKPAQ
jgi:predicted secreted hydrolase